MYVRVAFAAAIHVDPEILIVDEALSVGDAKFQHRCYQRLRDIMEQGNTILVVSHNTDTLLRICHRGVVIDGGRLHYCGHIADAVNKYAELLYGSPKASEQTEAVLAPEEPNNEQEVLQSVTVEQLSNFHQSAHDHIISKPNYNEHETRLGNREAEIIDFEIVVNNAVNPTEIVSHGDVELYVKILFHKDLDNVSLGFAVVTIDGTYIFGTNLESMNQDLFSGKSGEIVVVKFNWKSHFAGGEQFLNIGCHALNNGEVTFIDIRRSVATLKFSDTYGTMGFVDLEVTHEIINRL